MVLQRDLQLSSGCIGSEASQKVKAKFSCHLCPDLGTTKHELKSDLQVDATCVVLEGAQEKPSYKSRPATLSAGPGAT